MPKGLRNLTVSFTARTLTHFGGVYLLHRFFARLGLRKALTRHVRFAQRNARYSVGEMLLALLYPMLLGLERLETTHLLTRNGVFQVLTGLPTYPNATTLRRFLLRFGRAGLPKLRRFHDRLRVRVVGAETRRRFIFDVDSTVVVVYGHQEDARRGYNPTKRGRRSYHPLVCFEGTSRDYWAGELRPGDAHTAAGTVELLERCFAQLPPGAGRVDVRGDKGFFDGKIVAALEERGAGFVLVARLTKPIKAKLSGLRYTEHRGRGETAEFRHQPYRWPRPYRFVVIRRPVAEEPSDQLTLFAVRRHTYQVLVTNLDLQPITLWRFYNDRAALELIIRELKGDYPLGRVPTKHFFANEAYVHLLLFGYNLIQWFKRLCLPDDWHALTLGSLRSRLLLTPGQFVRTHHRPVLQLPATFPYQDSWHQALKKITRLRL
ncbi:MAG: IS1380 family transposase [Terriglobia bacterium]